MVASRDGNVVAFSALVRRYARRLVAYCLQFTLVTALAEEVAQDTWLGIWSNRVTYLPTSKFVVLLFTAARNRCRNVHRSKLRQREAMGQPSSVDVEVLESASPSVLDEALSNERRARMEARVLSLSPSLREALILRIVDELPYADVAAILQIPETTARTRVHQAVTKLRELERKESVES